MSLYGSVCSKHFLHLSVSMAQRNGSQGKPVHYMLAELYAEATPQRASTTFKGNSEHAGKIGPNTISFLKVSFLRYLSAKCFDYQIPRSSKECK